MKEYKTYLNQVFGEAFPSGQIMTVEKIDELLADSDQVHRMKSYKAYDGTQVIGLDKIDPGFSFDKHGNVLKDDFYKNFWKNPKIRWFDYDQSGGVKEIDKDPQGAGWGHGIIAWDPDKKFYISLYSDWDSF